MDTPDQSDKPTGPYMSPKLREKLEGSPGGRKERDRPDELPPWMGLLVLGLLVAAVAFVGFGIMKSNAEKKKQAAIAHADSLRAAATAESLAAVMRDSLRADSIRVALNPPKPTPKPKPSPTASAPKASSGAAGSTAAAAPPAETRKYGLIVGEYIDEGKANEVKDQLAASTSLPGRVIPVDNGNSFRVILGSFEGRAAAEKAAGELSGKGLVNQAQVTALPK